MEQITKNTYVEELLETKPHAVSYFLDKGIACLVCGEPFWGTIEELVLKKGYSQEQLEQFVEELNRLPEKIS
ncbi:MAG TPA: DUF1858 domain-containing protein [Candidatus Kapabacteria bacterium]|nr:DUF1858 domain-containing protein [Candidatus Kapabacteria bacterium]